MKIKSGTIFGKAKILKYYKKIGNKILYKVECLNCGNISNRRGDHLKRNPQFCKVCKDFPGRFGKVESVFNSLLSSYKGMAKNRNISFALTKEEFSNICSQNCYYCGQVPIETVSSKSRNRTNTPYKHNGVDRVDSSKGYILSNVVSCCGMCNLMKNHFNLSDFLNKIKEIYNKHLKVVNA